MNILITGAAGYLGTALCKELSKNHRIIGIDNLLFNQGHLTHHAMKDVEFYNTDIVNIGNKDVLKDMQICLPMSCLVGMPIVKNNPSLAQSTNLDSIVDLMDKLHPECKIIIPSTNSGYGTSTEVCTESSPLNSVSLYGKLKEELEEKARARGNVVIFRLATVFGLSDRMRFDLLVNFLTYQAIFENKIDIFDNGFLRNYVHVLDVVSAFQYCLDNWGIFCDRTYNLGHDGLNCTKENLAEKITKHIPVPINNISGNDPDKRNYRISSDLLYQTGWTPQYDLDYGINELIHYCGMLPRDKKERERVVEYMSNDKFVAKSVK